VIWSIVCRWGLESNNGEANHANCHSRGANDEQDPSTEAVDCPSSIQGEENTEGSVESVDKCNLGSIRENALVDGSGVCNKTSLT
jgi:hypothetical protein